MTRKRTILFLGILLALLLVPTVLPYLIGHLLLPFWAYLLYAFILLVNAGIYLANRLWLIDRFFIQGWVGAFFAWNLALLLAGGVLEILVLDLSGRAALGEGLTVSNVLDIGTKVSQRVFVPVLGFLMVLIALAVALSDEWRLAAFKYREAQQRNERLGRDIDSLKGQVDALRRREAAPAADSISVKVDLMMTKVPLDDILYVKADGDYIVIHKADGKTLMTLMTLKSLEKQLPFDRFCRTHRSWIVNVDKARGIRDGKILVGDAVIPLSDSCKAAFFELLSHKSIFLKAEPTVLKEK
ncbi:MAG: LytTR family transcriptional regulator DNA-binding domain-containing protein [Bacteroidales bacterium]|nr:LytTR family transcriptional regulator DNA-binding domain-containing protein [Bacteroidales bacterium]MBR0052938.1 LytTR family transcriptional regulator DNA-binding domain-containing protein [Bacteroidales bacterium]